MTIIYSCYNFLDVKYYEVRYIIRFTNYSANVNDKVYPQNRFWGHKNAYKVPYGINNTSVIVLSICLDNKFLRLFFFVL